MSGSPRKSESFIRPLEGCYYQDNNVPYAGPERRRRATDRPKLTPDNEDLIDAIRETIFCRDNCIIPKEAHGHVGHFVGAVKDFGDGDIGKGIRDGLTQNKEVGGILKTFHGVANRVIQTVVGVIVIGVLALIWAAIKAGK